MRLILATANPAKARALARYLPVTIAIESLPPTTFEGGAPDHLELAETCQEIATAKAVWWSRRLPGEYTIGTDGGVQIPALGNEWNPARTARFEPAATSNLDRAIALLGRTKHLPPDQREIAWIETLAVARDGHLLVHWTATGPRGYLAESLPANPVESAFWVPSLWLCPEFSCRRLSSLTEAEQDRRDDHWQQLARFLAGWCSAYPGRPFR